MLGFQHPSDMLVVLRCFLGFVGSGVSVFRVQNFAVRVERMCKQDPMAVFVFELGPAF